MVKYVSKRGDTLIEVMLAVGIFSMVAIAVVAVMSGGTSSAQTALETTLAREEIDAQAEALRFIQASYIAENEGGDGTFAKLWRSITETTGSTAEVNVISSDTDIQSIASYKPTDCSALYDSDGEASKYGFVINTRALGTDPSSAVISVKDNAEKSLFKQAATYPRLVYDGDYTSSLVETNFQRNLQGVEGIYVLAVKDPKTTHITEKGKTSAYYDFYIRTCWYGTGDKIPSTISTVIRLYDPGITRE
jgi:type II secretory pathway pseudopilin PulG